MPHWSVATFIFALSIGNIFGASEASTKCPDGTIPGFTNNTCWLLNVNVLNFIEAEEYCQSMGGHLASIHNAFDNIYLADQARKYFDQADDYFVGGNNLENRKQWAWIDNSAFDFTDWAEYEPVDDTLNNCLVVSVSTGLWHTHDCTLRAPFVCLLQATPSIPTFTNPILPYGPDPWVLKHEGYYYYTHTMQNSIVLYKTKAISQVGTVDPVTIWRPPSSGNWSSEIWAPEIHYINDKFYVYFGADNGNNDFHRIYVIENANSDPTIGNWTFKGKVADPANDHWAIDADTFEFQGKRYLVWSGWEGDTNVAQNIYIAEMDNPWTLKSSRVMISTPTYAWETVRDLPIVNEGPAGIVNPNGSLFVVFSASGCWTDSYALGYVRLRDGGDPLTATDWTKFDKPILSTYPVNGAYSPGHNGFFKSPDDSEYWIIYHANPSASQGCGTNRSPRIQKFTWNSDGSPNLGNPAPINIPIQRPSGEI